MTTTGRRLTCGAATALAAFMLLAVPSAGRADETTDVSCAVYRQYCGACHGPRGKGDGVAASFFRTRPTDLTQLARGNHGEFPFAHTMRVIDGRETSRAHGDPDMPVWGEVFRDQSSWSLQHRTDVQGKLMMITECIRSLQEH